MLKKVLHITPHLGAGVGTVVINYLARVVKDPVFEHTIACLDYANDYAIDMSKKTGFQLLGDMSKDQKGLLKLIDESDIILIHWWNHPLLYDFLIRNELPASRLILWSHAAGYPPPITVTDKILRYPDKFVFTSPLSYDIQEVRELPKRERAQIEDIWSTGGLDRVKDLRLKKHDGFIVGYIGTIDYTKMHPDFLEMCDMIDIPDVKFVVVGGPNSDAVRQEAERRGLGHKFLFTGFVSERDKWKYLAKFDVLGYPLAPHHYGTCDQVIQEAMAVGVVPITLSNPMEKHMVRRGTGVVAKSKEDYAKAVENLYHDKERRLRFSRNARRYALQEFSLEDMVSKWNRIFHTLLKKQKTVKKWETTKKKVIMPRDIFLEALGRHGKYFSDHCKASNKKKRQKAEERIRELARSANWRSKNKSTVHQFNAFLPGDEFLSQWSDLML